MGNGESSEAHGQQCAGCGVRCPPANAGYDFLKACEASRQMTYCFWTPNEFDTTITKSITVEAGKEPSFSASESVGVSGGSKLFKYFRNCGYSNYYCSKCFVKQDMNQAKSVFLELAGKGQIVSTDFELVKIGGRI